MIEVNSYSDTITSKIWEYAPKLALAILTLIIGLWIVSIIINTIKRLMAKKEIDAALQTFLGGMLSITLKIMLVISVMGMVGIEMTSFVAILGAAGLAIGLALSGTLQNFAGGVLILILKPYKIGDVVEMQGYTGKVTEIQIFNTVLHTPDNKKVIIPNSPIATGSLVNYSSMPTRRVDLSYGIGYNDDIDKAREVLLKVINSNKLVLKDPEPFIAVAELGDSSVNFAVRLWVNAADYWTVAFFMNENVKKAFDKENISIPFPQMDVHLDK